jgi:hypothetical protein
MACDSAFALILYEHCPTQVNSIFLIDCIGVSTPEVVMQ